MTERTNIVLTADHITYSMEPFVNEQSNIRLWAIQKQYPTNEAEYNAAYMLSRYWYYHKMLGCEYNAAVQRRVNNINLL
jgi:hypothetical protein